VRTGAALAATASADGPGAHRRRPTDRRAAEVVGAPRAGIDRARSHCAVSGSPEPARSEAKPILGTQLRERGHVARRERGDHQPRFGRREHPRTRTNGRAELAARSFRRGLHDGDPMRSQHRPRAARGRTSPATARDRRGTAEAAFVVVSLERGRLAQTVVVRARAALPRCTRPRNRPATWRGREPRPRPTRHLDPHRPTGRSARAGENVRTAGVRFVGGGRIPSSREVRG